MEPEKSRDEGTQAAPGLTKKQQAFFPWTKF